MHVYIITHDCAKCKMQTAFYLTIRDVVLIVRGLIYVNYNQTQYGRASSRARSENSCYMTELCVNLR